MIRRLLAASVVISTMTLFVGGVASAAPKGGELTNVPVTGTFTDAGGGTGTFEGTLDITRFTNQNGTLAVTGTVTGTLTDASGTVLGTDTDTFTAPLQVTGTCRVLHLELGPLDLDLLGLVVHLDKVVLDITAQSGPGNLLGNLLCAVAGLLDRTPTGTTLNQIVNLLNQILAILG